MDAVKRYVVNTPEEVTTFKLYDLEQVYLEALSEAGVEKTSHISRFADKVYENDCGVVPLQKDSSTVRLALKRLSLILSLTQAMNGCHC